MKPLKVFIDSFNFLLIDLEQFQDHYEPLLQMSRQYRHLLALKQAGHAHDISGACGMQSGELAVPCHACPQPRKNLLQDWESAPLNTQQVFPPQCTPLHRWLFALFLGIDANFQMCCHNKSSEQADPSLSKGWAYFVEKSEFKTLLAEHTGQIQEKSSCASHNAVNPTDSKNVHGLAATSISAVVCARHNFKWPSTVGDLQKGEKYVNMDYMHWYLMPPIGPFLLQKLKEAIPQWDQHASDLVDFEEAIPTESLMVWRQMVEEW
ncbi:hypothetical protein BDR07DRAFT_1267987 [Suillus spraguei]|nr:hypothetical protein BDR07DRAFT_1267987 [Suillus spraguei]